jgi:outer membrane receptor protein involved in Fe transport
MNAWTSENPTATIPMVSLADNNNEMRMSTYFVEDGSYCKLKYIKLGYDFPKVVTKAIHAQNLNIFFQVENVFTATKYTGLDPELPLGAYGARVDNGPYPRARNFSMGINMAF